MSAIDAGRAHGAERSFGFGAKLVAGLSAWRDARMTRNALHKLTDRELDDIGLSRGDIERVARGF